MGKRVWGADVQTREPADDLLEKVGITVLPFGIENITSDIDLVITTGAHGGLKNPEVVAAQKNAIPVMTHAEALGNIPGHLHASYP
jgi:UDP-N-acetylmuramate-alanine ligase